MRELIPLSRTRKSWILRRAARTGNNKALLAIGVLRSPRVVIVRSAKAVGMIVVGASTSALGVGRRDRAVAFRGLQRCAEGVGTVIGLLGIRLA